jgi:hypothetical protein
MDAKTPPRGYPLIALFLVLTACGIVAALIGPAARAIAEGHLGAGDAMLAGAISSIAIMGLGGFIGLFHFHRGRGFSWGLITGAAVGLCAGPMIVSPREALGTMFGLSLGGTFVVLAMTAAFRLASRPANPTAPK